MLLCVLVVCNVLRVKCCWLPGIVGVCSLLLCGGVRCCLLLRVVADVACC